MFELGSSTANVAWIHGLFCAEPAAPSKAWAVWFHHAGA
jgi:hypothetical protein